MIKKIQELRKARGGNAKLKLLKQWKGDEDWLEYLKWVYTSSVNYYVSAPNDFTFKDEIIAYKLFADLSLLAGRAFTGHAARNFAIECSQKHGELFRLALGGSIRAGVSITSINKAYPGLIAVFKVMLAKDSDKLTYPLLASTKYDGVRLLAFVYGEYTELVLRSGKFIRIASLETALKNVPLGVYDGELVSGDGKQASRTKITGSVNKCLKGTATDISDYTFCIFDYIQHTDWTSQSSLSIYTDRLARLSELPIKSNFMLAEQIEVNSNFQVSALFNAHLKDGYEGLILRSANDFYVWGRSTSLIKKKAIKECILGCYDTTEGTGKYEGMIGALRCAGMVDGKQIRVKLGSGLSDYDRELPRNHYIGRNIEVLYNDIVRAEKVEYHSLFLPRFKRLLGETNV